MQLFANANPSSEEERSSEIDRIVALPKRPPVDCTFEDKQRRYYRPETQALIEIVTAKYAIARPPLVGGRKGCMCLDALGLPCIETLNAMQAWFLWDLERVGGAIGIAGVGSGKTISMLLSILATGKKRGALFAKSDQRSHYKKAWRRLKEHFRVPSLVFDDASTGEEFISPQRGAPVLHFVPYSKLGRPESSVMLDQIRPEFFAADELHKLAGESSTALRFRRYMDEHVDDDIIFCGASGSALGKTIKALAPILKYSLWKGSPYPINPGELDAWAAVLDPQRVPDRHTPIARKLYKVFGNVEPKQDDPDVFGLAIDKTRNGLKERLVVTPGIITTTGKSSPASLVMHERKVTIPDSVKQALMSVRGWVRPDGEEFVETLEKVECAREVGSGFYNCWIYPRGEPADLIDEWFRCRKSYFKAMRQQRLKAEPFLDSAFLLEEAVTRAFMDPPYDGELPTWKCGAWPEWRDIRDLVKPQPKVRWIDDFLARDAAKWATEHRGIVWVLSTEFGVRIAEIAGIPYHEGGPHAEDLILAEKGDRSIVVSANAHREGRDGLQRVFSKQLVAQLPAGGDFWEQMLGRLCRPEQKADEVETWLYLHTEENREALRTAIIQSEFTQSMTPNEQLLKAADMTFGDV